MNLFDLFASISLDTSAYSGQFLGTVIKTRSAYGRMTENSTTYEELNNRLPAIGDVVTTSEGLKGEVQSVSVLRQLVKVVVNLDNDEKEIREYKAKELKFKPRRRKNDVKLSKEEMKELEALEKN